MVQKIIISMLLTTSFFLNSMTFRKAGSIGDIYLPYGVSLASSKSFEKIPVWDMDHVFVIRSNIPWQLAKHIAFVGTLAAKELSVKDMATLTTLTLRHAGNLKAARQFFGDYQHKTTQYMQENHHELFGKTLKTTGKSLWDSFKDVHFENVRWDKAMIRVRDKLCEQGYTFNVATNQSDCTFYGLYDAKNSPLKKYSLGKVHTKNTKMLDKNDPSSCTKKPDARYFESLLALVNPDSDPNLLLVFVDDKLANVQSAADQGLIAIHAKSAAQVEKCFKLLGMIPKQDRDIFSKIPKR